MTRLYLRPLAEPDLPLVHAWMQESPEAPAWNQSELTQIVRGAAGIGAKIRKGWAAEDTDAALVGFAIASALCIPNAAAECEIEFLLIAPSARRQGVGLALVQAVLAWARGLRAAEVWLEVRASNQHALRLYERCGFSALGRRTGYYVDPPEDAVLMRCGIDSAREDAPV